MFFHKWAEPSLTEAGWRARCDCDAVMSLERGQFNTGCPTCGQLYTVDWTASASRVLDWALGIAAKYQ